MVLQVDWKPMNQAGKIIRQSLVTNKPPPYFRRNLNCTKILHRYDPRGREEGKGFAQCRLYRLLVTGEQNIGCRTQSKVEDRTLPNNIAAI
jgi:hypothetical protein